MSAKQHVGAQSDALVADPDLEAARAAQQAARAAVRPQPRQRTYRIGNGDPCPVNPEHGQMFVLQGGPPSQFCPDQSHDMNDPSIWPTRTFEAAVREYRVAAPGDVLTGTGPPAFHRAKNVTPKPALTPSAKVRSRSGGRVREVATVAGSDSQPASTSDMMIDLSAMLEDLDA